MPEPTLTPPRIASFTPSSRQTPSTSSAISLRLNGVAGLSDLVHPQVMVERICMNHDERKAFAGNFVVNFNAVGETIHDSSVPIVPIVPAVPNDKSRENTTF